VTTFTIKLDLVLENLLTKAAADVAAVATPIAINAIAKQGVAASDQVAKKGGMTALQKLGTPGRWMKDKTKEVYEQLQKRYGKRQAFLIFCAGQALAWGATAAGAAVGVPVWLPGSSLWGMAPFAAIAEIIYRARGGDKGVRIEHVADVKELTRAQIIEIGRNVIGSLISAWEEHLDEFGGEEHHDSQVQPAH